MTWNDMWILIVGLFCATTILSITFAVVSLIKGAVEERKVLLEVSLLNAKTEEYNARKAVIAAQVQRDLSALDKEDKS